MKSLKIGVVVDQLLTGGVQLAAIEQVRYLNKLGHKAKLLIMMRKKYSTDFSYLIKDIPHQFLSDSYPLFLKKTYKFPIFSFFSTLHLISPLIAPFIIKGGEYDILISLGSTTCITTQAIYKKNKIPYIAVIHDPFVYILEKCYSQTSLKYIFPILKPLVKFFERSFVKDAKETIIISKVHFKYMKQNYNVTPKILALGAYTLDKIPSKRGDFLLSFGRWQNEKNPQFLLNIIKKLPRSKLIIAGSWTDQSQLNQFKLKIRSDNLEKRVQLIPYYTQDQLESLCEKARMWLHPHFEAFGLAGLEAAGFGLPIIIPQKSGVTEHFTHGVHGFFPKKVEINEYLRYIKQFLGNERLAYQIGRMAWLKAKKEFSWEANVKKLLEYIYFSLKIQDKPQIYVLEIGHILGTAIAGGDKLMEPMARRLIKNFEFKIIVPQIGSKHWEKAPFKKGVSVLPKNLFDESSDPIPVFLNYLLRMWQTFHFLKKRLSLMDNFTNFIYSSTNILPDILPAYLIKKKFPQTLWVARIHHLIPPPHKRQGRFIVNIVSFLMQWLSLQLIKSDANLCIALNEGLKKELLKKGFEKRRLKVLGAGIEYEKIRLAQTEDQEGFDGIVLGRLHSTKGAYDAPKIWKQVLKSLPEAKLAIIGEGYPNVKRDIEAIIKQEGLQKNIKLLGFIPDAKVYSIMKKAKVFLFLDYEAGWGLAAAEAMAAGLPVVGWDIGILGKVYRLGFIKVKSYSQEDFVKSVVSVLSNVVLQQKLASQAKKEAQRFDWEITSLKFRQILDKMRKND